MSEDLTVTEMAERYLESVSTCENVKNMVASQMAGIMDMSQEEARRHVEENLDTDVCREK